MSNVFDPDNRTSLAGIFTGPGSQPEEEDGGVLEYMKMPSGMMTFSAPEVPEADETEGLDAALAVLDSLADTLAKHRGDLASARIDLTHLDADNLAFINQVLGEGEVSIVAGPDIQAQEAVFAGIWRVRGCSGGLSVDYIEVGAFPSEIREMAFLKARDRVTMPSEIAPHVLNAPSLVPEINDAVARLGKAAGPHVINLSLLPHTEEDLALLHDCLGRGDITILSRGYGSCRITSTQTLNTWWVRYYNSQDTLILNLIEIVPLPEIACAASEDLAHSNERLSKILEIYR